MSLLLLVVLVCSTNAGAVVFNPDGATHDDASQSGWALPPANGDMSDFDNCLRCHRSGGIAPDKSSYLWGGHKNMSRPADGLKWGMPGVDATHPYLGDAAEASVDETDGSFLSLWIQEDYPRLPVDWTTGVGDALSSVSMGYCAKDGTGAISSDDVPDLAACPECESPIMGNGNAGYPLNYPDAATCAVAAADTGKPYTWVVPTMQPLYWIYGGAGLEGGPAMVQRGSQQYKCGRCHTTGWTANHTADDISGKHPQSDFPGVDFKTLTTVGSSTLLLRPSTAGDSATDVSSWDQWGIECSRCHMATDGGHKTWPTASTKGGDIVALCMNCHRMESDTAPRVKSNQNGYTADTFAATPFTNKQQQPDGFAHHPDGNEFLNGAHGKFTGTTFGSMGCPPYAINGYGPSISPYAPGAPTECTPGTMNLDGTTSSLYTSKFAQAAKMDLGIADRAAGSCVTCHDVHKPLNENVAGMSQSVSVECTDCHSNPAATVTPQIDLAYINHLGGAGTPLENAASDPVSACEVCHQPPGIMHLFRINTDAAYTMYGDYTYAYPVNGPSAAAAAKNVNLPNYAADGDYANAMWIDLDNACGQCHGGGVSETDLTTTGSVTAGSTDGSTINALTVADATGFASGKEVTIAGAGVAGADFKTVIAKVSGTTVYLTYPAVTSVAGATVTVSGNPTANGAPYLSKSALSARATGIHSGALRQIAASKTILVKNPPGKTRALDWKVVEKASANIVLGDPTVVGAALNIALTPGGTQCVYMPAAGWTVNGTVGFKYKDADLVNGPVKVAQIKKTSSGVFQIKVSLKGDGVTVVPGNPTDAYALNLSIGTTGEYCSGSATALAKTNDAKLFKVANDTRPDACVIAACPALP